MAMVLPGAWGGSSRPASPSSNVLPLVVRELHKMYGDRAAVSDVSFTIKSGEIVALLGPNGAGKTTTITMVLGLLEPTNGELSIAGWNIRTHRSEALARANLAASYSPLPGNLTVLENLRIFADLYGIRSARERITELIELLNLEPYRKTRCGVLSSGEQSRVSLAKALLNAPALLVLDEPTASLDPATARVIRDGIKRYARESGAGVLWTSHNMNEVEESCDRVLFLHQGTICIDCAPREIPGRYGVTSLEELFTNITSREKQDRDRD